MFTFKQPNRITITIAATACAAALGWTDAAPASTTASVADGTLTVHDDEPVGGPLTVTCDGGAVRVNGAGVGAGAGAACAAIRSIVIDSNGTPNTIELAGAGPADGYVALESTRIAAGFNDLVKGSPVRDVITGGPARAVEARAGDDDIDTPNVSVLDAGPGDDLIRVLKRDTTTIGGEGTDTAVFDFTDAGPVEFDTTIDDGSFSAAVGAASANWGLASIEVIDARLPGGGQKVDASGFSGSLRVDAGGGNDQVVAGPGADELTGGAGADTLEGGLGQDVFTGDGGPGAPGGDTIAARDGERDTIDCGAGSPDSVVGDRIDTVAQCETVELPPISTPTPTPSPTASPEPTATPSVTPEPDRSAPVLELSRASLRGRLFSLAFTCPVTETRCIGGARLRASGRRAGRRVSASLGRVALDMPGGGSQTIVKQLTRPQRQRLRKVRRVQLGVRLDVRDAAGNRTTQAARLALRRP